MFYHRIKRTEELVKIHTIWINSATWELRYKSQRIVSDDNCIIEHKCFIVDDNIPLGQELSFPNQEALTKMVRMLELQTLSDAGLLMSPALPG